MRTAKLSDLVNRFGPDAADTQSAADGDLLARFVASRDEAAFAEIVRRYGPLVFAVCRRVTGNHHLAEDAFQAVFVVFAAKAATVRPASALPGFFHAVACRTALRARTMNDRRRRHETPVERLPEPAREPTEPTADLAAILDEEIARLPEALRGAVVLCELEGCPRAVAAERLGVPEGTVSSRLAAARKTLARSLRKRGVVLSAAALSAALAGQTSAGVPADLASRAVSGAMAPALTPAAVAALSSGVLRLMFAQKLKVVVPLVALALGAIAFAALASAPTPAPEVPPVKPVPVAFAPVPVRADPKPLPKGPNKILFYRSGRLTMIDPEGKKAEPASEGDKHHPYGGAVLSPDGKALAVLLLGPLPPEGTPKKRVPTLYVRGPQEQDPGTSLGVDAQMVAWSPDGTESAGSDFVDGKVDGAPVVTNFVVNVQTKQVTKLKLPDNHVITDWSRDGKHFLTTSIAVTKNVPTLQQHLMNRDGSEHKAIGDTKLRAAFGRLSSDGTRVLCLRMEPPPDPEKKGPFPQPELIVIDVATGKATKVQDVPQNANVQGFCWSPDGKRIAYSWRQLHDTTKPEELDEKEIESFLVVCDPDGKNQKTIATEKAKGQWNVTIGHVDWR